MKLNIREIAKLFFIIDEKTKFYKLDLLTTVNYFGTNAQMKSMTLEKRVLHRDDGLVMICPLAFDEQDNIVFYNSRFYYPNGNHIEVNDD